MTNSNISTSQRANELANRITQGANALVTFANSLTDSEWQSPVKGDGRTIGVVVHHVASSYPVEIELAQLLASGKAISEVTMDAVDQMNASHAQEFADAEKQETLELLTQNSKTAALNVRALTDTELDNSATVSLNADAPLTTQFFIEDHALRHSFHHLAKIKETLNR